MTAQHKALLVNKSANKGAGGGGKAGAGVGLPQGEDDLDDGLAE